MARMRGHEVRVYYGAFNISDEISAIDFVPKAATHDTTTLSNGSGTPGTVEKTAGLLEWEAKFSGFYDSAANKLPQRMEALLGTGVVLSIYDGSADALNEIGVICPAGVLSERGVPVKVADMVRINGAIVGTGRVGLRGRLLQPEASITATTDTASIDRGVATSFGGLAVFHLLAVAGGNATLTVQHSVDAVTWVDLASYASAATGSQAVEVTGTVNRYIRGRTQVTGSATPVFGFSRHES